MKFYSIDTHDRLKIYFLLAMVSLAIFMVLSPLIRNIDLLEASAPSSLMIFFVLVSLFDRYLWKWPIIKLLVAIPVIDGIWEGELIRTRTNGDIDSRNIRIEITQNWRTIALVFKGERSESTAEVISMSIVNKNHIAIKWIYNAHDLSGIEYENLYGEGTSNLSLETNNNIRKFIGSYYSSKLKKGKLSLQYKGKLS